METVSTHILMDPIDLNFLPLSFKRSFSKTAPLWSTSHWDKNEEYFEFEIRNKAEDKSCDDLSAILNETTTCYICDIEVPKHFIKDHNQSKKHIIYKRIADAALDRMKKHLNKVEETITDHDPNVYFCSSCVAIVKKTDEIIHNRQQSHKNSLMNDKILSDFLFFYTNNDIDIESNLHKGLSDAFDTSFQSESTDLNEFIIKGSNLNTTNENPSESMSKLAQYSDVIKKKKPRHKNKKMKTDVELNGDLNTVDDINLNGENLIVQSEEINTNDLLRNSKETSNNEQGLKSFNALLLDVDILTDHFKSKEKQEIDDSESNGEVFKELDDQYSVDKNENDLKSNVIKGNAQKNDLESNELELINNKSTDEFIQCKDTNKISDSDCLEDDKFNEDSQNSYNEESKHNEMHINEKVELEERFNIEDFKIGNINGKEIFDKHKKIVEALPGTHKIRIINDIYMEIETMNGAKMCVLGDNYFCTPKNSVCYICPHHSLANFLQNKDLGKHLNTQIHIDALNYPLKDENCIRTISKDKYHCVLCNEYISDCDIHINTKRHQTQLKKCLVKKGIGNIPKPQIKEETREVIFHKTEESSGKQSEDEQNSTDDIDVKIETMIEFGDNEYFCDCCKTSVNIGDMKSHLSGTRHRMNKISNVHYMFKEENEQLQCKICQIHVLNSSISEHVNSPTHKHIYYNLLNENWIEKSDDELYCRVCDETIFERNELLHIFNKKHSKNRKQAELAFEDKEMPYYCELCDLYIPNKDSNIKTHKINTHKIADNEKLEENQEIAKPVVDKAITAKSTNEELTVEKNTDQSTTQSLSDKIWTEIINKEKTFPHYCQVCKVNVPNNENNILAHNNGTSHRKKLEKRMEEKFRQPSTSSNLFSLGVTTPNQYYCSCCDVYVSNHPKNIIEHHCGAMHRLRLEASEVIKKHGSIKCKLCKVIIPNSERFITKHRNEQFHLDEYEKALTVGKIYKADNRYYCVPCQGYIDTPLTHLEDTGHKEKLKDVDKKMAILNATFQNLERQLSEYRAIMASRKTVNAEDIPFLKAADNPNEIFCDLCSTTVPSKEYNISTHLNGMRHKNNFEKYNKLLIDWQVLRSKMNKPNEMEGAFDEFMKAILSFF